MPDILTATTLLRVLAICPTARAKCNEKALINGMTVEEFPNARE